MRKFGKTLVIIFAIVGAGVALIILNSLFYSSSSRCAIYPVMKIDSPNKQYRIEQIQEICKDNEELKITVMLIEADNSDTSYGVFGAYSAVKHSDGSYRPLDLEMVWLDEKSLVISYPKEARIFMKDSDVQKVKVQFDER
jgi:hypothetical protein